MSLETSEKMMAGLLNDIPVSDGSDVYIRQMNVSNDDPLGRDDRQRDTTAGLVATQSQVFQ